MARKGGLAYEVNYTDEECRQWAAQVLSLYFGYEVSITHDNAAKYCYELQKFKGQCKQRGLRFPPELQKALGHLFGATMGRLKGT